MYGDAEIRCRPDPNKTKGMKFGNYGKINSNGVVPENTLVEDKDIIIAKIVPIKENRNDHTKVIKYEDYSQLQKKKMFSVKISDRNGDGSCALN